MDLQVSTALLSPRFAASLISQRRFSSASIGRAEATSLSVKTGCSASTYLGRLTPVSQPDLRTRRLISAKDLVTQKLGCKCKAGRSLFEMRLLHWTVEWPSCWTLELTVYLFARSMRCSLAQLAKAWYISTVASTAFNRGVMPCVPFHMTLVPNLQKLDSFVEKNGSQ